MNIHHCLFWIKNNRITAVVYKNGSLEIMQFNGYPDNPLNEDYWNDWKEFRGFCTGDKTDLCFVYDNKPDMPKQLLEAQCDSVSAVWCRNNIQSVLEFLCVTEPTEIFSENGVLLMKAGCFRHAQKESVSRMTALYVNAQNECTVNKEQAEITPFIKVMLKELNQYYEENDKR